MIADGMGGAAAGEVASAMCAEAFAEIDLIRSRGDGALRDAIVVANTRIHERAASDPAASGMGTTVTAALVETRRPRGAGQRRRQPRLPAARGRPATPDGGPLGGGRAGCDRPDLRLGGEQPSAAKRGHASARRRGHRAGRHLLAGGAGRRPGAALQRRPHRHGGGGGVREAAGGGQELRADRARPGAGGAGTGRRGQRHHGAVPDRSQPGTGRRAAANGADPGSRPGAGRRRGQEPQAHRAAGRRRRWA